MEQPNGSAAATKTKPPQTRLVTSAPDTQAEDFIRDRGDDYAAMRGLPRDRDMTPLERLRAVRLSRVNYKASGLYGQLVDTLVNFVVGDGVQIRCEDDAVQEYVDEVLAYPVNAWDRSLRSRVTTTFVDGEYLLGITIPLRNRPSTDPSVPVEPMNLSRMPLLGRMDSDAIEEVRVAVVNQDQVQSVTVETGAGQKVTFPIARPGVYPRDNGDGTATAVVLWRVNVLRRRGLPFFSRTVDKAHLLDGVVDELARKAKYTSCFWMKGEIPDQGSTAKNKALEKRFLAWMRSMKPGEALVTTPGVKVDVFSPNLGMPDQKALYDLMLDYVLGSHGIPRHWFSSGGDTNRATSVEQGTPIFRAVDSAQAQFVADISDVIAYVIWLGKESGEIAADASDEFTVAPTDVATRDSIRDVKEVNDLVLALDSSVASGIISAEERQKIGRRVLGSKGWGDEIKPEDAPELPQGGAVDASGLPVHRVQDGTDPALAEATVPGTETPGGGGAAPGAPAVGAAADVPSTAMNGAQVAALAEIVQKVTDGSLPREAAEPMILGAFPSMPEALVQQMLAAADAFDPPAPAAPPVPPNPSGIVPFGGEKRLQASTEDGGVRVEEIVPAEDHASAARAIAEAGAALATVLLAPRKGPTLNVMLHMPKQEPALAPVVQIENKVVVPPLPEFPKIPEPKAPIVQVVRVEASAPPTPPPPAAPAPAPVESGETEIEVVRDPTTKQATGYKVRKRAPKPKE